MTKYSILITIGFIMLCSQCLFAQNISSLQKTLFERQIDSVFHCMINAADKLEYDKLAQGVNDKYNAGFILNSLYFDSFDSLINFVKTRSQGVRSQNIKVQKEKITLLSENIALLTAFGDSKTEVSSGEPFTVQFFWTFVYQKINNEWKVVQSHQSNVK